MPRRPTVYELRSSPGKIWIPRQRLPVKRVGTIISLRGETALGLAKLILASQKKIVSFRVRRPDRGQTAFGLAQLILASQKKIVSFRIVRPD